MGSQEILEGRNGAASTAFSEALLADLRTLEQMLEAGALECDAQRIGAEQEMFLIDPACRPAAIADHILDQLADPAFTTEMGKFNLEANLTPRAFAGGCLRSLEEDLQRVVAKASAAAHAQGADILLAGILPSVRLADLTLNNLTDKARYRELNRTVMAARGGAYRLFVKGVDELDLSHDNVMPEACCCSFQLHFQLDPRCFATQYNAAQAVTAPVLAAAVNSPLLLGRRLWSETRVALFQHSVDARAHAQVARNHPTRVTFGDSWVRDSVLEIYREQVARFRPLITSDLVADHEGAVPELKALMIHNGAIWRWNRPCYGITNNCPHLRLEFRCLPAGPTVVDEVANAAFLFGLLTAIPEEYGNVAKSMSFEDAKSNFFAAARHGLKAQTTWLDGKNHAVDALILQQLLPLAHAGLRKAALHSEDINRYLGVIRERTERSQTGSSWMLAAAASLDGCGMPELRDRKIVAAMLERQKNACEPVHRWTAFSQIDSVGRQAMYENVIDIMSTDLYTAAPEDSIAMAAETMTWRHIRHLPVEDASGKFIGLISSREILRVVAEPGGGVPVTVADVMNGEPVSVGPEMKTRAALELMLEQKLDCLPVVNDGELLGLVSSQDMLLVLECLWRDGAKHAFATA